MENKKVIVTGVSGQLGSYMVDFLLKETDFEVVGAARRTSQLISSNFSHNLKNPKFRIIHFDLCDSHSITSTIKNEKPDYFINFGAQTFVADSWDTPRNHFQTNALSVVDILEAIRQFAPYCRFYSSGSSEQFGNVAYSPQDEKHPFKPRSPYGASKCAAHQAVKVWRESYNLYAIQGILFNNESPRRQEYFVTRKITKGVSKIAEEVLNNKKITPLELGNLDARRDWSYAEDFVSGVWKMLNQENCPRMQQMRLLHKRNENGTIEWDFKRQGTHLIKEYVLASGETHSIREFVELAFEHIGFHRNECRWEGEGLNETYVCGKETLVKINKEFYRPAEVQSLLGSAAEAAYDLDWKPKTKFEDLVEKMIKHDLKN